MKQQQIKISFKYWGAAPDVFQFLRQPYSVCFIKLMEMIIINLSAAARGRTLTWNMLGNYTHCMIGLSEGGMCVTYGPSSLVHLSVCLKINTRTHYFKVLRSISCCSPFKSLQQHPKRTSRCCLAECCLPSSYLLYLSLHLFLSQFFSVTFLVIWLFFSASLHPSFLTYLRLPVPRLIFHFPSVSVRHTICCVEAMKATCGAHSSTFHLLNPLPYYSTQTCKLAWKVSVYFLDDYI